MVVDADYRLGHRRCDGGLLRFQGEYAIDDKRERYYVSEVLNDFDLASDLDNGLDSD